MIAWSYNDASPASASGTTTCGADASPTRFRDVPGAAVALGDDPYWALADIARLARYLVPAATDVGITVAEREGPTTLATAGTKARDVDEAQYARGNGPCLHAMETQAAVAVTDTTTEGRWASVCSEALAVGLRSILSVPFRAPSGVRGALNCYSTQPHVFTSQDRRRAEILCRQAAATLHYRNRFRESNAAADRNSRASELLQRSLLPRLPQLPGWDVAARYQPAESSAAVGGDWFDLLPLPDGRVGVVIGDVMGHDMASAATMGRLRSYVAAYAWRYGEPALVLTHVDDLVAAVDPEILATVAYATLGPAPTNEIRIANAGHPPLLLRERSGNVSALDGGRSTMIGVPVDDPCRIEATAELRPGSTLVLYSDGLVESRGKPLDDGIAELAGVVGSLPPDSTADQVCDGIMSAIAPRMLDDDIALMAIRTPV